jgi:hypothetical protein
MDRTTTNIYSEIVARLSAVRRKHNVASIVHGALFSAFVFTSALLVALIIEELFYLGSLPRAVIFWLLATGTTVLVVWKVSIPFLRVLKIVPDESDVVTARKVGAYFPEIRDHLVNILQLHERERDGKLYSSDLIVASFEDVRKEIAPYDFTSMVGFAGSRRLGRFLAGAGMATILLFVLLPSAFFGSLNRLLHYSQSFAAPAPFTFLVEPGDLEVIKGSTVPVVVRVEGQRQSNLTLAHRPQGQAAYEEVKLEPSSDGSFHHSFPSLKNTTQYFVRAGNVQSSQFVLKVTDRPSIKMLRVSLTFPAYANIPPRQLDDNVGDVTALRGTRVSLGIETNKELNEAIVVFNDGAQIAMALSGRRASIGFVLSKDRTYHIDLKDKEDIAGIEPIEYTLKVMQDAYPTAAILVPGVNLDVAGGGPLNMLYKITDDFGFSSLRLAYRLAQSRYERPAEHYTFVSIPIPDGARTEAVIAYQWSLAGLSLVPEDVVSYYIEVFDNDNVAGPKSARSESYILRLPSLEEVFADIDKGHEVSVDAMKDVLKEAQQARKDLESLQQEMKKNQQKMDWQEQKKAEELLKKYQELQKKIDEVTRTIDEMVNQMEQNKVLSKETLEKYQELQHLMEQMNSPELAEAMKKLQQAMQQLTPEQMKQALQQFDFSEENFRKSIERTMNLLKRLQIEQKVDEAVKRTEELLKKQEELAQQTEQTNPQDKERLGNLAQQQKDLKDQLDRLRKELADLQKKMEEFPTEMPLSELNEAQQELDQSDLDEEMDQIAQQMQQQQTQQAMQGQQRARKKLSQVQMRMQQMQQAMRENQQRQIVNEMRKALQDLLQLSRRQEDLKNESQRLEQNSRRFRENTAEQMEVLRDLGNVTGNLARLSQRTFGITPEMGKSIGDAMRQMSEAMQALDQRNGSQASSKQSGAMGSLNEAAQQVQGAMNGMMQGSSGGMGMAGFMQRLQQMTSQQQGINQGTQNLGGMSPQQAAETARLAGEQGMVRKSLEQLAREAAGAGELSKMLGDLNKVAQEMREVQTDLAQGNVNPETLRKQERILSRLLDSQRSARERDFEKRRKAESGKEYTRRSPADLDPGTQEGRNRLRQDLLKALEEGYSRDYEELIKKYFEALENTHQQN